VGTDGGHPDRAAGLSRRGDGRDALRTPHCDTAIHLARAAFGERHAAYPSQGGFLGLFSIADGALVWSREHKRRIADAPLIARDRLFIAAEDGQLLVYRGDL
jgi:hypothetical protein